MDPQVGMPARLFEKSWDVGRWRSSSVWLSRILGPESAPTCQQSGTRRRRLRHQIRRSLKHPDVRVAYPLATSASFLSKTSIKMTATTKAAMQAMIEARVEESKPVAGLIHWSQPNTPFVP